MSLLRVAYVAVLSLYNYNLSQLCTALKRFNTLLPVSPPSSSIVAVCRGQILCLNSNGVILMIDIQYGWYEIFVFQSICGGVLQESHANFWLVVGCVAQW